MTEKRLQPLQRPLSEDEQKLVIWLIEHGTSDRKEELKQQLQKLSVCGKCTCGCPTVDFAYDGVPISGKGSQIISDYSGTVDGQDVGVMLFETDGRLNCLEGYSWTGSDQPFGLPRIDTLRPVGEMLNSQPKS